MKYFVAIALLFIGQSLKANTEVPVPKNLNGQYRALSADCELVNGVRTMKLYKMDQFWTVVLDSLNGKHAEIRNLQTHNATLEAEILSLKSALNKSNAGQAALKKAVDNLNVFGSDFSKAGFVTFMTVIIVALIVLLVILFLMYRVSFSNAREFRRSSEELSKEFEHYKHQTVEKQIKLSRELQDYRNRMAELKSA